MKLAIMQPYFLPYIGYFQLIAAVNTFVVYDNIKYTKKGWINRNRLLRDGQDAVFSLPLKAGSDTLDVRERELAGDFRRDRLLNQFREAYRRAPYFEQTFALLERIVGFAQANLFGYLYHALVCTCEHLDLRTAIRLSSELPIDHGLKSQDKVLALCEAVAADTYINAIGGMELYDRAVFAARGIELKFIRSRPFEYAQFGQAFVPWLSIVDVMMFNPIETVQDALHDGFDLTEMAV